MGVIKPKDMPAHLPGGHNICPGIVNKQYFFGIGYAGFLSFFVYFFLGLYVSGLRRVNYGIIVKVW
jgi:hypothetical protein